MDFMKAFYVFGSLLSLGQPKYEKNSYPESPLPKPDLNELKF
jgi:hypothetical protein